MSGFSVGALAAGGDGHLPPVGALTVTDLAMIAAPAGVSWAAGRTVAQRPTVTSASRAGVVSMMCVDAVKATVAALRSRCVSRILLSATDLITPSTWSAPRVGGGAGGAVRRVGLAGVAGVAGL
ncbi:hypothetical protein MSM1_14435 [Mycobacterium sp. SM1]|uniref:hypothetical protein n=1 Tax=Mycobacterium sp. SM1 TaxID=2816243 RepID=UPI001BCB7F30|nr:hypothetical protein [Mycobacterium sp. SM1]MBS4729489.1 hypothetical protein [Mycobacterium sp. SM1]